MASFIPYPDNRIPNADPIIYTYAEITCAKYIGDDHFMIALEQNGERIFPYGAHELKDKDGNIFTIKDRRGNWYVVKSESGIMPIGRVDILGNNMSP